MSCWSKSGNSGSGAVSTVGRIWPGSAKLERIPPKEGKRNSPNSADVRSSPNAVRNASQIQPTLPRFWRKRQRCQLRMPHAMSMLYASIWMAHRGAGTRRVRRGAWRSWRRRSIERFADGPPREAGLVGNSARTRVLRAHTPIWALRRFLAPSSELALISGCACVSVSGTQPTPSRCSLLLFAHATLLGSGRATTAGGFRRNGPPHIRRQPRLVVFGASLSEGLQLALLRPRNQYNSPIFWAASW